MSVGKPRYYSSPEEMQKAIDEYFAHCEANEVNVKITGLALWLGFTSRQDIINYENYSAEYHDTIKKAKLRIESAYEDRLINRGNGGDIFALKNFDWKDKSEVDNNIGGQKGNPIEIDVNISPSDAYKKLLG